MNTCDYQTTRVCDKCGRELSITLTTTDMKKAYASMSFECVCGHHQSHNIYVTGKEPITGKPGEALAS